MQILKISNTNTVEKGNEIVFFHNKVTLYITFINVCIIVTF